MKSKLAIVITLSGYILLAAYVLYGYVVYGMLIIEHFFRPPHTYELFFRILMLTIPIGSTITGYLINERKKLLEKADDFKKTLIHASNEWRTTFDSMPYGVMLLDGDFNIIRTNNYIAKVTGFPIKELIGKKCYEVIHGTDKPIEVCPMLKVIENNGEERAEYYEPGPGLHLMENITPIFDEESSPVAYVNSLIDISEIKETEKKLIASRDAFFNMLKDLDFSYKELKGLYESLILSFVNAIDAKSPWTRGHSERVTEFALAIGKEMGLKGKKLETLRLCGLLHDIGKIGTYDLVLDKPGKLTEEEFELVKIHPEKGIEILTPIKQLRDIIPGVLHHHERHDGKGYPHGLKGEDIPLCAKILCVADSFDSMTSDRPYRPAPGVEYAMSEFVKHKGSHFDPQVVEAFLKVLEGGRTFSTTSSPQSQESGR